MSTNKFQYWPSNGQLGSTKFTMPTTAEDWPSGDALIGNFVYSEGKLVDFIDIKGLTPNTSKSTTIPYDYVNIELPFAENVMTINRGPHNKYLFITFNDKEVEEGEPIDFVIIDFSTAEQETIDTVRTAKRVVDNKLYDADDNLIGTWDTSKLEVGGIIDFESMKIDGLFCNMDTTTGSDRGVILSEFNSDLSSLSDGTFMFSQCPLRVFNSDLSNLTDGSSMFSGCPLTSFNIDLSNLTNGDYMFSNCQNLTSFNSDLSNLTKGDSMFNYCKLDAPSVKNIIDTINSISQRSVLGLGFGCDATTEDKDLFAQEVGEYADMESLLATIRSKGWIVAAQYNGRPDTTYSLRRPSGNTLPVFAKLEETEDYADYTSEDGSKKYNLRWFHETTGSTEGYTQFNSLEEAVAHFNIKPIER